MNNTQDKLAFNHHCTAFGYLNRARKVPVNRGADYLAVDFIALEGVIDNPDDKEQWDGLNRTRYTARVSGAGAQRLISDFTNEINDRDTVVSARVTLGVSNPEIFTHKKGPRTGEQDVSMRSRLLYVSYLKVGDVVIDLESYNASSDQPGSTGDAMDEAEVETAPTVDSDAADDTHDDGQMPGVVRLSKDDPDFEQRKEQLKADGYRWDRSQTAWVRQAA